jgi:hypothetical protein
MDEVNKAIEDYQYPIRKKNFQDKLNDLLGEAKDRKNAEPKTDETRYWAVVYTELEKVSAYTKTYLGAK